MVADEETKVTTCKLKADADWLYHVEIPIIVLIGSMQLWFTVLFARSLFASSMCKFSWKLCKLLHCLDGSLKLSIVCRSAAAGLVRLKPGGHNLRPLAVSPYPFHLNCHKIVLIFIKLS